MMVNSETMDKNKWSIAIETEIDKLSVPNYQELEKIIEAAKKVDEIFQEPNKQKV